MAVLVRSYCAHVALTTAIAMTATAVYPAAQTLALRADNAAHSTVNLPALTLASLESSLAAADSTPPLQLTLAGAPSPGEASQAVTPAAAEANLGDLLYDAARVVAMTASLVVLPLWWIAFPITFPLATSFIVQNAIPGTEFFLPYGVLFFPFFVAYSIFPPRPVSSAATATPSASAARSPAASTASISDTATASTEEPAINPKADGESTKPAVLRSNRPAKPAAAVVSTEASDKRDDAASVSKGNAACSRSAGGRSGVKVHTPGG